MHLLIKPTYLLILVSAGHLSFHRAISHLSAFWPHTRLNKGTEGLSELPKDMKLRSKSWTHLSIFVSQNSMLIQTQHTYVFL